MQYCDMDSCILIGDPGLGLPLGPLIFGITIRHEIRAIPVINLTTAARYIALHINILVHMENCIKRSYSTSTVSILIPQYLFFSSYLAIYWHKSKYTAFFVYFIKAQLMSSHFIQFSLKNRIVLTCGYVHVLRQF
ncbi:hypothetical protein ACJX0J_010462 [Zea mays]